MDAGPCSKDVKTAGRARARPYLSYRQKKIILSVFDALEKDHPMMLKSNLVNKCSEYTGVSESSVYRILRQRKTEGDVHNPKKKTGRRKIVLDDAQKNTIRDTLYKFIDDNKMSTLKSVVQSLNEDRDNNIPKMGKTTLARILHDMDITFGKGAKTDRENHEIFSDDNSSIQSSPWQRDHSWKQTTPCRNISKEMILYFWRPKNKRLSKKSRKRRAPYSLAPEPESNSVVRSERTSTKDNKKSCRRCLLFVVQSLIDRNFRTSTPPRTENVVSPRKRFLREMEKDKVQLEDSNCQKRSRSKSQPSQPVPNMPASVVKVESPSSVGTSIVKVESPVLMGTSIVKVESPVLGNGIEDIKPPRNCSYSITSLLAEDRNIKRSPSNSPSHYSPVAQPQYCSPTSEDRWYSESVDRLRSIELSQQVEKCGGYPPYPPQSYLGPYMYPFPPVPPYYGAGVYGRGYVVPSMYHTSPLQMPIRHETPSCSWTVEPTRDADHREETITDMPLNLSKHSG